MEQTILATAQGIGILSAIATYLAIALLFWKLGKGIGWIVAILLVPLALWAVRLIFGSRALVAGQISSEEFFLLSTLGGLVLPVFLFVLVFTVRSRRDETQVFR